MEELRELVQLVRATGQPACDGESSPLNRTPQNGQDLPYHPLVKARPQTDPREVAALVRRWVSSLPSGCAELVEAETLHELVLTIHPSKPGACPVELRVSRYGTFDAYAGLLEFPEMPVSVDSISQLLEAVRRGDVRERRWDWRGRLVRWRGQLPLPGAAALYDKGFTLLGVLGLGQARDVTYQPWDGPDVAPLPTPPLFILGDDLIVLPSVTHAQSYLEPVDVDPGEKGYDAAGRLLRVTVHGEVRRGRWTVNQSGARVQVELAEETPGHAAELQLALREWLGRAEPDAELGGATLQELVRRALRYMR